MKNTAVINAVGLSKRLLGEQMPFLTDWCAAGRQLAITPVVPAVTCTAQSTYLTGKPVSEHGIVGNGWYFQEECEVKFWRQSNRLVQAPKLWEVIRKEEPGFTCANMFWWYNMYSSADYSVTPRPNYLADGRKIPDVYSHPPQLRDRLQNELGTFPLFKFWGPATSIASSRWIAEASKRVYETYRPNLNLVYLPHLDYNLQRYGHNAERVSGDLRELDELLEDLIGFYESHGVSVVVLSEYGITGVDRPVHPNRVLRKHGFLDVRTEKGGEHLDAGRSAAFAVSDHQVSHVYVNDQNRLAEVREILGAMEGVEHIWDKEEQEKRGIAHERSGDFLLVADGKSWFTYYYWEEDAQAPDFARTVDIHRKPGYDPVEMMLNPKDPFAKLKVARKLIAKKLGFRTLMNVIPLEAGLIRGSHGRVPESEKDFPVFLTRDAIRAPEGPIEATGVFDLIKNLITT